MKFCAGLSYSGLNGTLREVMTTTTCLKLHAEVQLRQSYELPASLSTYVHDLILLSTDRFPNTIRERMTRQAHMLESGNKKCDIGQDRHKTGRANCDPKLRFPVLMQNNRE